MLADKRCKKLQNCESDFGRLPPFPTVPQSMMTVMEVSLLMMLLALAADMSGRYA